MSSCSPNPAPTSRPASLACLNCRRVHLKCDGNAPRCTRCTSRGLPCSYTPSRRGQRRGARRQACQVPEQLSDQTPIESMPHFQPVPSHDGEGQQTEGFTSWVDDEELVNLYYLNFHSGHPILLPRSLYWDREYPQALRDVVEFIGSQFSPDISRGQLRESSERELENGEHKTPEMVQARLLYAISLYARNEICKGQRMLTLAIDTALELGMHRSEFATSRTGFRLAEEESMRRTWYELYVTDGCIAASQRTPNFKTFSVNANVLLPCEDSMYEHEMCSLNTASRNDFKNSVFEEDEIVFSSFSYRIEAVHLLGRVLDIAGKHGVQRDMVQATDNALAAFVHHLPLSKSESEIVNTYGELDELMFQAHAIVQYATILLHFPRGDLASPCSITAGIPGDNSAKLVCPCTRQHIHSIKAIDASKALSMLAALRTPAQRHSPFFVYFLAFGAIVQLSASMFHSRGFRSCVQQHRDRITLILGVLKTFGRYWAIAEVVLRALKKVSRVVFQLPRSEQECLSQQEGFMNSNAELSLNAVVDSLCAEGLDMFDLNEMTLDPGNFCI